MNIEEIASWVLYNSDHYVVGCVGDVPRRSGTFANGQYIPLIKVNDTYYYVKYVEGNAVVDYNNPYEYDEG